MSPTSNWWEKWRRRSRRHRDFAWAMRDRSVGPMAQWYLNNLKVPSVYFGLLGRFYGLFRVVSLVDGIIFNYWIMGKVPDHFVLILTAVGAFYGTAFLIVCLRIKEGEYPPPPQDPERPGPTEAFLREARKYVRECFTNPYYMAVFLMLMAAAITFSPANMYSIPFANNLGVNMDDYGKATALTYGISLILAPSLGVAIDAFGKNYRLTFFLGAALAALAALALSSAWYVYGKFRQLGGPKNYVAPE